MSFIDPKDEQYICSIEDPAEREAAASAVTAYRLPDKLALGDSAPALSLIDLKTGSVHALQPDGKPLVLIFGSYT